MLRTFLGVVAGALVGLGVVYGWQLLGHAIFPFSEGMVPTDPAKRMVLVDSMPFAAQAWVVAGYAVGVAVGGLLGNWIADARWPAMWVACMVAGVFFVTLTVMPHPFWMQVTGILLPLLAGLGVAAKVGRRTLIDPEPRSPAA
jgi:MFS family permease